MSQASSQAASAPPLAFDFSSIGDSAVRTDDMPPQKSVFEELTDAARRLARSAPRVLFAFIGNGPRHAEITAATAGLPNVRFQACEVL